MEISDNNIGFSDENIGFSDENIGVSDENIGFSDENIWVSDENLGDSDETVMKGGLWKYSNDDDFILDSYIGLFMNNDKRKLTGHKHVITVAKFYLEF